MDKAHGALRSLTASRLRLRILKVLESPMRLSELKRVVDSNAPNTSCKAKDLQGLGLVKRDNGDYRITRMGRIVDFRLSILKDTLTAFYQNEAFWSRTIDKLPEHILCVMHEFAGAELIANGRRDLNRVEREITNRIKRADGRLFAVIPAHSEAILDAAKKASERMKSTLVTLEDDPELHYGAVFADNFKLLFTEMLDMAIVKERIEGAEVKPSLEMKGTSAICL